MIVHMICHSNTAKTCNTPVLLSIDSEGYTHKPCGEEPRKISNILRGYKAHTSHKALNIEQIAELIQSGHTHQGAQVSDKKDKDDTNTDLRFLKQQIFFIDIDNVAKDGTKLPQSIDTPEQILEICKKANIMPCIIYESFSSGKKDPNGNIINKYHVLFAVDKPITDVLQARRIILGLLHLFGNDTADKSCKDPARIFYATAKDKKVYVCSAVNSAELLLSLYTPEEPAPAEPIPATAPERAEEQAQRDFEKAFKSTEADPDRLLMMINPNNLTYEEWLRVSASYKHSEGAETDLWIAWNNQYTGVKDKADLKAYKGLTGKGITKGTLKYFAQQHSPSEWSSYIEELKPRRGRPRTASKDPHPERGTQSGERSAAPAPEQITKEQAPEWKPIQPFEKAAELAPFPMSTLPKVLHDYVKAVSEYNSVYPEMCILPMFSALALSLQGKATVLHPGTGHPEPLNLFCITIAPPGERKTSTINMFTKPIYDYERRYNSIHQAEIDEYSIKHKMLSQRLDKAIKSAKKAEDEESALQLKQELTELEQDPKTPLNYMIQDVTPEALISTLYYNHEKAAIISDESTLFKVLGGAYSSSKNSSGVNFDILLSCYDGSQYKVDRKTSGNIYLKHPLVTIGTMIQPQPFKQILANADLNGKGLLQRFIFSQPRSNVGNIPFTTPRIPEQITTAYNDLMYNLLDKQTPEEPAKLICDKEAFEVFRNYHDELQKKQRPGGMFSDFAEYASKQFAKVLRIAALLHLCEHSEAEKISGLTAIHAVCIGAWLENQAAAILEADMISDTERNARYVMRKLLEYVKKNPDIDEVLTKRDINRMCRRFNSEELHETLSYLDDMNVLRYSEEKQTKGRPIMRVLLNPAIKDFEF